MQNRSRQLLSVSFSHHQTENQNLTALWDACFGSESNVDFYDCCRRKIGSRYYRVMPIFIFRRNGFKLTAWIKEFLSNPVINAGDDIDAAVGLANLPTSTLDPSATITRERQHMLFATQYNLSCVIISRVLYAIQEHSLSLVGRECFFIARS